MVVADGVVMAEEVARYEALVGDRLTSSDAKLTPAPLSQSRPLGKVWTDERKEEVRQYRAKHGLKKTAEHYGVSQALISKHVPAGRPQKAQQSFWQGLKK